MKALSVPLLCLMTIFSSIALAETVDDVLSYKDVPGGVVFEIVSSDRNKLKEILPKVRSDMKRLRIHFPDMPIAVVSHGQEQFALTTDNQDEYKETHSAVKILLADKNVTFQICGTYASMHNVSEDEFPEYVDVVPHGPLQIKNYIEVGYVRIKVD